MHIVPCNSIWTGIHVDGFTSSTVLLLDTSHKDSQCIELVHGAYWCHEKYLFLMINSIALSQKHTTRWSQELISPLQQSQDAKVWSHPIPQPPIISKQINKIYSMTFLLILKGTSWGWKDDSVDKSAHYISTRTWVQILQSR